MKEYESLKTTKALNLYIEKKVISGDGCRYWAKCKDCPLPVCVSEYGSHLMFVKKTRDAIIKEAYGKMGNLPLLAEVFDISARTAYRAVMG